MNNEGLNIWHHRLPQLQMRYVASQPWPFPRSLMLGYRAVALDVEPSTQLDDSTGAPTEAKAESARRRRLQRIRVDENELEVQTARGPSRLTAGSPSAGQAVVFVHSRGGRQFARIYFLTII